MQNITLGKQKKKKVKNKTIFRIIVQNQLNTNMKNPVTVEKS